MAIIRREGATKDEKVLKSIVSQDFKCTYICESCERYFDCERPEREQIYQRRRMEYARKALSKIKHKILVAGGKGGVGKSTVAANIAIGLAMRGYRTTIVDQDFDGSSIPKMLGVMTKRMQISEEGLVPVECPMGIQVVATANLMREDETLVWFHDMRRNASEEFICHTVYGERDFLVVDLPPGTSSDTVNTLQLIPDASGVVMVTIPPQVSQATVLKAITLAKKAKMRIFGVVENMSGYVCECCGKEDDMLPIGGGYDLAKQEDVPFLGRIQLDGKLANACDAGIPFVQAFEGSVTAKAVQEILAKVIVQLADKRQWKFEESSQLGELALEKSWGDTLTENRR